MSMVCPFLSVSFPPRYVIPCERVPARYVSATRPSKTRRGYGIISKLGENMQVGEFEEFGDEVDRGVEWW